MRAREQERNAGNGGDGADGADGADATAPTVDAAATRAAPTGVHALGLEPHDETPAGWTSGERCIDWAVRTFQPTPAMTHVELLMPPVPRDEADRTQFATYAGRTAAWQSDRVDGFAFYLHHNAGLWRAVPVFAPNAATAVRAECDLEQGVGYSLTTYLTGVAPLRWVARFLPDARRTPCDRLRDAHRSGSRMRWARRGRLRSAVAELHGPTTL